MIPLGFELDSGQMVSIPLGHAVATGVTQRAGKTTLLEAMAVRSRRSCLAFITKRGEGSFRFAREIPPYYEETIEWKTLKNLAESITERKMDSFTERCLRAACRTGHFGRGRSFVDWQKPQSFNDLILNIDLILSKSGGQREMSFGDLREVVETVIEELATLEKSCASPELTPGLNVINLERYEFNIQSLIVRSVIRWILRSSEKTIAILPEAWKFARSVGRSPVRDVAEQFIREAAALQNFLWIDSQTLSGISESLLSQIRVWLFGVQKTRKEVERTLNEIPDHIYPRPTASDIQSLGIGQFIACYDQEMYRVYVWPAWMESAAHAQAIARGEESVESAREIVRDFDMEHGR
jgi:hypothetical protein